MTTSFTELLKTYFKPQLFLRAIIISLLLLVPFIVVIDQIFMAVVFPGSTAATNPLILLIGGESNILGRIGFIILLSLIGTAFSAYILHKTTTGDDSSAKTEEQADNAEAEDTVL
ncbi:MAG: hypothetical protein ACTSYO_09315 [Candidatus Ranarchaeia archaeon]